MNKLVKKYSKLYNVSFKQAITMIKRELYVKQLIEKGAK